METIQKKSVIIIGGGFAGLAAAKVFADEPEVHVTLLDKRNHHLFQPLLYQVATAGLNPADIAVPIRAQFSKVSNVEVHLAQAQKIDLKEKNVVLEKGVLAYDYLIVCCGAEDSYFGHDSWEDFAPGLKSIEQATEIRRRLLLAFEEAENCTDEETQKALLTFVIVGGGATGVELAGAIADLSRTVLVQDFKKINPADAQVILVEAGPRLLPAFKEVLSQRVVEDLIQLGVQVKTSTLVEEIGKDGVRVGAELIRSRNVIWAAGVKASSLEFFPEIAKEKSGKVRVTESFSLSDYPEVFVIGDMAAFKLNEKQWLPGLAPAAIQAGRYVAKNILNRLRGNSSAPFRYIDKGQMATIGKHLAVGQFANITFTGYFAWLAWLFVHIFYLIGFKNRAFVLIQWTWSYLFSKRGARLITRRDWK